MKDDMESKDEYRPLTITEYLGPENMGFISRLGIEPKGRMVGAMAGSHRSPFTGEGYEFALHRPYATGDDIRRMDWNVFGRTDKHYIKRFEQTTELRGLICLDCSGSMGFAGDPAAGRPPKFDFACRLAAALAFIVLQQGDSVGMAIVGSEIREVIPASAHPSHLNRILETLRKTSCEPAKPGREDPPMLPLLQQLADRFDRREMIFLISDLMEDPERLSPVLARFRHGRHEGMLFHVLDPMELDFPFRGWVQFKSAENAGEARLLEGGGFRKAYLEALGEYLKTIRRAGLLYGFNHAICRTSRHWRETLLDAITRRELAMNRK